MPDFAKTDFFLPECTSRIDFSTAQKKSKNVAKATDFIKIDR